MRATILIALLSAWTGIASLTATPAAGQGGTAPLARRPATPAAGAAPAATPRPPASVAPGRAPGVAAHPQGVTPRTPRAAPVHPVPSRWRDARVGVYLGSPFYASPWWYGDPFYPYHPGPYYSYQPYPPPVVRYEEPTVYIEQTPPPPPQYWFYCEDSKTYYPYVQTCAAPWLRVIPHTPQ